MLQQTSYISTLMLKLYLGYLSGQAGLTLVSGCGINENKRTTLTCLGFWYSGGKG
ncbi:hypothetical protein BABINDRAFT_160565 [Babjeviella inositovora NRRL Y-12698]|uniref:Uncharacterized protein n=1 Tax=Babjeviella inositovora NRRL Y-12698 TaxID=984486 RepID=A0A1E3QU36_9ASCO|nr:uncharacterized protein BABINDRAFT_160565 [Babjeviella inositovora NRRL Y-12698]ODQ81169.1 hypothetical protein BABINDRAFT_160565 [Babjeviella inositovora NRRL Y-12698]